jgi:hypothetical protein
LYEDEFSGKTAVFPPGNYDVDQMKAAGMDNDMVSSMKVENEIEIDEVAKEGLSRLGLPTGCASGTITETLEGVAVVVSCCPGAARTEGQGSCSDSHPNMYALTGFVCWTGTGNNVGKCTPPAAAAAAAAPPAAAAAPTYAANVFTQHEVGGNTGGWGGACTCPDGQVYQVSDKGQHCQELNCIGGTPGTCNQHENKDPVTGWSGNKVTCGAAN